MAKKNETNTSFTKEQLYNSKKYEMQKDILGVMLDEGKEYTFDEVDNLIKEFLKKEVE